MTGIQNEVIFFFSRVMVALRYVTLMYRSISKVAAAIRMTPKEEVKESLGFFRWVRSGN